MPERIAEVFVVGGIDERVDQWVGVTEPRQGATHSVTYSTRQAERLDHVQDEEWQPTDDETADDDSQRLGGLVLPASRPLARRCTGRTSPLVLRCRIAPVNGQRSTRRRTRPFLRRVAETQAAERLQRDGCRPSVRALRTADIRPAFFFDADHLEALAVASRRLPRRVVVDLPALGWRRRTILVVYRLTLIRCRFCRSRRLRFHRTHQWCSRGRLREFHWPRLLTESGTASKSYVRRHPVSRHFENVAVQNQHHHLLQSRRRDHNYTIQIPTKALGEREPPPKRIRFKSEIRTTSKIQWKLLCPTIHLCYNFHEDPISFLAK